MDVSIAAAWTCISQLDGSPNQDLDCGETATAMLERYLYGPGPVLVSPDTIRRRILGNDGTGYSYLAQLSDYLTAHQIPNHWWVGHGIGSVADRRAFRDALALGYANIALYFWDVANQSGGHFCNVVADTDDGITTRANPWTDALEIYGPAWWAQAYQGCGLIADIDPLTFRRRLGLLPVGQVVSAEATPSHTPAPVAAQKPTRYRVRYDGQLHSRPSFTAPVTGSIKQGWQLVAVAGDSTPWVSVRRLDGVWGWTRREEIVTAA